MQGMIQVTYTTICKNDTSKEITLKQLLSNEKVQKAIKSEFASGVRNLSLSYKEENVLYLKTEKEHYSFSVQKNFFADLLELAEEDAQKHKRLKKECDGVEIVDIETTKA